MDFEYLKQLDYDGSTSVPYTIREIVGAPVLHVTPATAENADFVNAVLKRGAEEDGQVRQEDNVIMATLITGWDGVKSGDGTLVPFSKEACVAFLKALPDWIKRSVFAFMQEPANFAGRISEEQMAVLAGN